MEATGDQDGGNIENLTGRKKPKLQVLKSGVFVQMKKKRNEGVMKQSHSVSDIIECILHHEDEFHCSQSMLGSRSLSHDSIFLADQSQSDPPRVLSQENIHGKIRTLQIKLQQQNIHLGPPPPVLPIKRAEDPGGSLQDDGHHPSPSELLTLVKNTPNKSPIPARSHSSLSLGGTRSEEEGQPPLQPLSPLASPQPLSPTPAPLSSSAHGPGVDFSTPPQFIPCLDNSAARHRMSIKPRNQRASTKNRRLPTSTGSRPRSESMNNLERPLTEEEEAIAVTKEMTRVRSYSSQIIRPGDGLTAPPIKSLLPASPVKSLVTSRDGKYSAAVTQPESNISPTITSLQHPILKHQAPTWEAASRQRSETAMVTSALGTKQVLKSVEVMADKPTSSAVSKKGGGDLREISNVSRLKTAQDSTVLTLRSVSPARFTSVMSEQSQHQTEMRSSTVTSHDKRDTLNKKTDALHEDNLRGHPLMFPQTLAAGAALRPPSLRRNTSPLDENVDKGNVQQTSTVPPPGQEDQLQKEFTNQHRPASASAHFSFTSARSHERLRTSSFTGEIEPSGAKREPALPPLFLSNLKTPQDQPRSTQLRTGVDSCVNLSQPNRYKKDASALTVPSNLTPSPFVGYEREDQANETQEMGVEATEEEVYEGVEEAYEVSEDVKGTEVNAERRGTEQKNAFGVKLRNTPLKFRAVKNQSDNRVKEHSTEISTVASPKVPEPKVPEAEGQKDISVGLLRGNMAATVHRKPPTLDSSQVSSSVQQSSSRAREGAVPIGLADLRTSTQPSSSPYRDTKLVPSSSSKQHTPMTLIPKDSRQVSLTPKESTPECLIETAPYPTTAKELQETSSELSWMSMAREKTRSLQQLFTSRLPDFAGLQTATRSTNMAAAPLQSQTSTSLFSTGSARDTYHPSAAQPSVKPLQAVSSLSSVMHDNVMAKHSAVAQPVAMPSATWPSQPSTGQSGSVDFSLKRNLSSTGQAETTQLSKRSGQFSGCNVPYTHSTSKTSYTSTTHTLHTAKQLSQMPVHQAQPYNQMLPQNMSIPQAPQATFQPIPYSTQPAFLYLSSSPKLPTQITQPSASSLSHPRPHLGWEVSQLGKAEQTHLPPWKGPVESRAPLAGGPGYRPSFTERREDRIPDPAKVEERKFTPENRPPLPSLTACEAVFNQRRFTESTASSVPLRLDKEDKWQKKTASSPSSSPSSPSPLQSISDSGQPSWMELAKRKSMAWSDKSMD